MNEKPEIEIETPRLTKLSIRQSKESPIQLYQIDLISTEKGKRVSNYSDRTRDFEWWVETDDICWKVPDGNYLVAQGPELWMVNVADSTVEWRSLKSLMQDVTARWSKLVITDKEQSIEMVEKAQKKPLPTPETNHQAVKENIVRLRRKSRSKTKKR